jgi:hypothetical protein
MYITGPKRKEKSHKKNRFNVFVKRVIRENLDLRKRSSVRGSWRTCDNEDLHNLYISPNMIRAIMNERRMYQTWDG